MHLTFITGNPDKARETQRYSEFPLEVVDLDLPEIQSLDPEEVVRAKAEAAFTHLQKPVLVDDTCLVFPFLGRLPGPFAKWFLKELQPAGLCRLLDVDPERRAVASVMYAIHDGQAIHVFHGTTTGTVSAEPKGTNGFGWDPIFIPAGQPLTYAEMTNEQKAQYSIRKQAFQKVKTWLNSHS